MITITLYSRFLHPYYKKIGDRIKNKFPNTMKYYQTALSIPLYYNLKFSEQNKIINILHDLLK